MVVAEADGPAVSVGDVFAKAFTVTETVPLAEPPRPSDTVTRSWKSVLVDTRGAVHMDVAELGLLKLPVGEAGDACVHE